MPDDDHNSRTSFSLSFVRWILTLVVGVGWGGVGHAFLVSEGGGFHNADKSRRNSKGLGARGRGGTRVPRTLKSVACALITSAVTFDLL